MGQLVNIPESLTDTVQKSSQSKALVSALKDGIDDKTFTAWTKLLQTYGVLGTSVTQFLAILTLSFKQFFGSQAAIKISADVGVTREFASGLYAQFDDEAIRGIGGFSVKEGSSFNTITINHGLKHLDLPKHRVAIELLQKALYPSQDSCVHNSLNKLGLFAANSIPSQGKSVENADQASDSIIMGSLRL